MNHVAIKVVEEPVLEAVVVHKVPLAAAVVETLSVADAWEVQPLWVAELVAWTDSYPIQRGTEPKKQYSSVDFF